MHIWADLLLREGALLAILLALGSGPAVFLSERFDAGAKIALAPVLGFCLGTCVTTTLLEFFAVEDTYWILVPLSLASLAVVVARASRIRGLPPRVPWRALLQLAVVCLAVAGPLTITLHSRHSVGPASYYFTDVDNFVAQQDAAQTTSIATARAAWTEHIRTGRPIADLTQYQWAFLAHFDANLDATPLDANVNALLGLGATETFAPFLIVLLLMGAFAAFAAVRYATRSETWVAALAGALTGGAMFLELWFDSFQAAITALSLVIPVALLAAENLRERTWTNLVLLALVTGALLSVYSLFIPLIAVAGAVVLAWRAYEIHRAGGSLGPIVKTTAVSIAALVGLAVAFNLVGFTRDIHYYGAILRNQVPLPRVAFHLPLEVLPGWLLQTREFWYMPSLGTDATQLLLGLVIPLVLLAFAVFGVRRRRAGLALVVLGVVCGAAAEYAFVSRESCTYCAERDLLPLGPILLVLVSIGLALALRERPTWIRVAGGLGVLLVVLAVGERVRVELHRFSDSSYFLDSANRGVLGHVPHGARSVLLEGYGESTSAQAEQALVYHLADERMPGHVSLSLASNLHNGTEYLNFSVIESPGPAFDPGYDYVLTRLADIATDRRVIARSDGIALEQRVRPLDVVTYSGVEVPLARADKTGTAWVQPALPLKLHVVGPSRGKVWALLQFHVAEPVGVPPQPGVTALLRSDTLAVCVPATGAAPVREAALVINAQPMDAAPPPEAFPPVTTPVGVALTSMRAVTGSCSP